MSSSSTDLTDTANDIEPSVRASTVSIPPGLRISYEVISRSGRFDRDYYLRGMGQDRRAAIKDPILHYLEEGAAQGRDPNAEFDTKYYLGNNIDVWTSGLNPFEHYLLYGQLEGRAGRPYGRDLLRREFRSTYDVIDALGLFDRHFYLSRYTDINAALIDPLCHYIEHGAAEGRDPNPSFSTSFYLATYDDVAASGMNPLLHYALHGAAEGRLAREPEIAPPPSEADIEEAEAVAARLSRDKEIDDIRTSGLFDPAWYRQTYPEIGDADPALHYYEKGGREGFDPSAFFDGAAYQGMNGDVAATGINPLLHWVRHGRFEGRTVPVRQSGAHAPLLVLAELCDPTRDEDWRSDPTDLRFSVLTPTYNTEPTWLRELHQTLRNQTYAGWEWVICDDRSTRADTLNALRDIAAGDPRVVLAPPPTAGRGISAATNGALALAKGDYVALVDHDDLLSRNVLEKVRGSIQASRDVVDVVYTDECKLSPAGTVYDLSLKPAWSPVLLENTMYIGHLTVYRTELMRRLGGLRSEFDGTQDYDLALRASEVTDRVVHVPVIGYLWRAVPGSTAASLHEKSYALALQQKALAEHARKREADAVVEAGFSLGHWRVNYPLPVDRPTLSYVIPTAGRSSFVRGSSLDLITHCITSLERTEFYKGAEIVVIHNGDLNSDQIAFLEARPSVKLVEYQSSPFNLAEKLNLGVRASSGEYICLLNDDVEAITPHGGEALIGFFHASPTVGAIAPFCLFEDGRSQHNGILLLEQGPSHAGVFQQPGFTGNSGFLLCRREMFAVTGAMMFCKRDVYLRLGGFDEGLPLNYNDVDFCLKLRAAGLSCVVDADVKVFHFESASKSGTFQCEKERLFSRWPNLSDPYFNPGFDQRDPSYKVRTLRGEHRSMNDAISFGRWLDTRISLGRGVSEAKTMFSVCVPIYNQAPALLNEMLSSVQMQTWPYKEIILVDDASTLPETRAWLDAVQPRPDLTLVRLEENQGIVGAQRRFLDYAKGDFIVPLDADDFLTVDALAVLAAAASAHPDDDIFYSDEFKSNLESEKFSPFFKTDFDPVLIANCCFTCHVMALRTSMMREVDGYGDRRATWCHDWDTTFRALASGREPVHIPEQLYAWRINPGSTASSEACAKPEAIVSQKFVLERAIVQRGTSDRLSVRQNPDWPESGMWSLEASAPISDVLVLQAAGWRTPDFPATLDDAAKSPAAWVAILDAAEADDAHDALLKLSAVAWWDDRVGVVSGALTQKDGQQVLWAGGVFTREGVIDPFFGVPWQSGGYHGRLVCQRCVDVAAPVNVIIRREHLGDALAWLRARGLRVTPTALMVALGRLAAQDGWFVAVTPLLRLEPDADDRHLVPVDRDAVALSGPDPVVVSRWYGAHLDPEEPFAPATGHSIVSQIP